MTIFDLPVGSLEPPTDPLAREIWDRAMARRERRRPEPIRCPELAPVLEVQRIAPCRHWLTYCDPANPDRKAKPSKSLQLQLFVAIGERSTVNLEDARFYRSYGKTPFAVDFLYTDDGKIATYFGRWVSARGEVGPFSAPVSMRIIEHPKTNHE